MRNTRKAQVTMFVIIALVVLFIAALAIYFRYSLTKVHPPLQNLEVSDADKPVQNFEVDCLSAVSKDALIKIGTNGGYTSMSRMHVSMNPYDTDVFVLDPQKLPYWYYLAKCDSSSLGCLESWKPPLCKTSDCPLPSFGDNSIEQQLDNYIEDNIQACLNNFSIFSNTLSITAQDMKASSVITNTGVDFRLDYPLQITIKGTSKTAKLPYVTASHDVKLKSLYQLGDEILQAEIKTKFLELTTMNLVSIYSGIDKPLPPTSDLEFGNTNERYWIRSSVQKTLQDDILPYINFIQIENAGNAKQIYDTDTSNYSIYANGLYKSFTYKLSNNTYFDLDANILYPYSDIYLNMGGSEVLKPEKVDTGDNIILQLIGFSMMQYKFKYDISYPVVVMLQDKSAFNGEGYTFDYSMQANIRQNVPVNGNLTIINFGQLSGVDLSSENQEPNKTISIHTLDKHTHQPLVGVAITYKCGPEYNVGETIMMNNDATISTKMPYCQFGGQILYEKPGYMGGAMSYNNSDGNSPVDINIELWPIVEKNVIVLKRTLTNQNNILKGGQGGIVLLKSQASALSKNDTVILNVEKVKDDPAETDVPIIGFIYYQQANAVQPQIDLNQQKTQVLNAYAAGTITAEQKNSLIANLTALNITMPSVTLTTLGFVPGTYTLDATLLYNGGVHIPPEKKNVCILKVLVCLKSKDIDFPAADYPIWPNGGANIQFKLTESDVYGNNQNITFYVLEMIPPVNWDMMQVMPTIQQYEQGKSFLIRPVMTN